MNRRVRFRAGPQNNAPATVSGRLEGVQGTRVTFLSRRTGRVLHTEDKLLGRIDFKTQRAAAPKYELSITYAGD